MLAMCPNCGKDLDPARAPVARIRDGHVVTFCSAACADSAPSPSPAGDSGPPPAPAAHEQPDPGRALPPDRAITVEIEPRPAAARAGKRPILVGAGIVLIVGLVLAAFELRAPGSIAAVKSRPRPAAAAAERTNAAPRESEAPTRSPQPAQPSPLDPVKVAAAATAQLRDLMTSQSPRVVRDAALALARQGNEDALALLGAALNTEPSPLAKIRIAATLALAGDKRGRRVLADALGDKRRDLRIDAARALALLGDRSAISALRPMLGIRTHKIGAAGVLALLGDPEGIRVLDEAVRTDESRESRMRAAVNLGLAGRQEVREFLLKILADGHYRVRAAIALAALGDHLAVPELREQLNVAALRVEAALSLRRLGATADLAPLAAALVNSDQIGQVTAAEAILILTDPNTPAELR
jgi:hypothetical protein